jgi:acyl-CoA thioesterase FadM
VEIQQRFEDRYRVRFDEADASGQLRPSGLLRYTQDLAWRHSEVVGLDRAWYEAHDSFWLVRGAAVTIKAGVGYGETVVGVTEVTGWRRVWARRHTTLASPDGRVIASIETDWVLLTSAGRPRRIPDEMTRMLAPGQSYRPQKTELGEPPDHASTLRIPVRDVDIDPMGHLNNAAYLDIVDEAVRRGTSERPATTSYRAEYLRPSLPGSEMIVRTWPMPEGSIACRIDDIDGREVFRSLVS